MKAGVKPRFWAHSVYRIGEEKLRKLNDKPNSLQVAEKLEIAPMWLPQGAFFEAFLLEASNRAHMRPREYRLEIPREC